MIYQKLPSYSIEEKKKLASQIREEIRLGCEKNGGHYASNLGIVDATISLLSIFDPLKDELIFDVGHQCYAYKYLTGRELSDIRNMNSYAGFQNREESPFDKTSNGHSGDSISQAIGMHLAKKDNNDDSFTISIIGESSLENGVALEGLLDLALRPSFSHFLFILNENSYSIYQNSECFEKEISQKKEQLFLFAKEHEGIEKEKYLTLLEEEKQKLFPDFFKVNPLFSFVKTFVILGHDFFDLDATLQKAKEASLKGPVFLLLLTEKGHGDERIKKDQEGFYHAVNPSFAPSPLFMPSRIKESIIERLLQEHEDLYLISPAMRTSSFLNTCFDNFPKQCIDARIAEEHAMLLSAGLLIKGKRVVLDIYSTFLQRAIDELIENILRQKLPLVIFLERASLVEDGSSHQGIFDVALLSSLPNLKMYAPYDKTSYETVSKHAYEDINHCSIIRVPREYFLEDVLVPCYEPIQFLKRENNKKLTLGIGPRGYLLAKDVKDCDIAMVLDLTLEDISSLLSYEEIEVFDPYQTEAGFVKNLKEKLFDRDAHPKLIIHSLKSKFYPHGSLQDQYERLQKIEWNLPNKEGGK